MRGLRQSTLLLCLLGFAGCVAPSVWYVPQGSGELTKAFGTWNLRDSLTIDLGGQVILNIRAKPSGSDTLIRLQFVVPQGQWIQLVSDTLEISSSNMGATQIVKIDRIESEMITESHTKQATFQALDRLEGDQVYVGKTKYVRNLFINVLLKEFSPHQFELRIPAIAVDGAIKNIMPVVFTTHRGVILYQQVQ